MVNRAENQPYLVPEIKQLWIDALESGEYTQGRGSLSTRGGGNCCLGVLCELAVKAGILSEDDVTMAPEDYKALKKYKGAENYPPHEVAAWAFGTDIPNRNARLFNPMVAPNDGGPLTSLSALNDDGYTFAEIAAYIREQL